MAKLDQTTRYHIHTKAAPTPFDYPITFRMDEHDDYVKYGHLAYEQGRWGGDPHWTPQVITQTWFQAETGKIPISGAGYGGGFAESGFDAIWLDMSEIVRPTRDGIHGREYISTIVDLGARMPRLHFNGGELAIDELPQTFTIPLPAFFDVLPIPIPGRAIHVARAKAAFELGNFAIIRLAELEEDIQPYAENVIPLLASKEDLQNEWAANAPIIEVNANCEADAAEFYESAKIAYPGKAVMVRLPLNPESLHCVDALVKEGCSLVHLVADEQAHEFDGDRFLTDAVHEIHDHLVEENVRDTVSLILSGGIAAAEHMPKSIICGADAVAIDFTIMIALGCALWADVRHNCKVEAGDFDADWAAQRLINLMSAWRDQLLESMGAMGIREVRRMRGELGRAMFYPREERKFRALFSQPDDIEIPVLPALEANAGEAEGDLRWTTPLILMTGEQARTARPPKNGLEFRHGRSNGGFDRLRFRFELEEDMQNFEWDVDAVDEIDLSIQLNKREDGRPLRVIPVPWYGGGMSFGSVSVNTMMSRVCAAERFGIYICTGEGGYPDDLIPHKDHLITQVATGLFGVREETMLRAPIIEFKYAQGAKPGLGGHLLGEKSTPAVAKMRQAVAGFSLFSPFPFHSVYSVEDHKKHVDWVKTVNPKALVSVKVSTPTDVDMVAVGSYYAGANILHVDGSYGGTGAAPEIAKKNIALPIEYAITRVHEFLKQEGIRDEITVIASGGVRTAFDIAKAIAMGADGCVVGTADLIAIGCVRLGTCEKDKGCPFGITTTDPEMSKLIDPKISTERIVNMYTSWRLQLANIVKKLGLKSIRELRGRTDLLIYLDKENDLADKNFYEGTGGHHG